MKVSFFGKISDTFGSQMQLDMSDNDVRIADLRSALATHEGGQVILARSIRAAVNDQLVPEDHRLTPGDDIAFLSPLSGG